MIQDIEDSNNKIIDHRRVHDVLLSPFSINAIDFAYKMKTLLNNEWINFIFCVNQCNSNGDNDSFTEITQFSYEQIISFDYIINEKRKAKQTIKVILQEIKNKIACILNFGQYASVLFNDYHPKKN